VSPAEEVMVRYQRRKEGMRMEIRVEIDNYVSFSGGMRVQFVSSCNSFPGYSCKSE
jgi:hypothetical protein